MSNRLNQQPHTAPRGQRGAALMIALLLVATVTIAAVAMASRHQYDIRRVQNTLEMDQAYQYAISGEEWAIGVLARDARKRGRGNSGKVDSLDEDWAKKLPLTQTDHGTVAGEMEDLQGRFNLNNLFIEAPPANGGGGGANNGPQQQQRFTASLAYFQRLLRNLQIEPRIAQAVVDWLDADTEVRFPDGAEDLDYLNLERPYRTGNTRMASPSELLLVKDVTPEIYERLAPFITALPEFTPINVNTAPKEVLQALAGELADAEQLLELRKNEPFQTPKAFIDQVKPPGDNNNSGGGNNNNGGNNNARTTELNQLVAVSSNYFLIKAEVSVGRVDLQLSSLAQRLANGKARVIGRSRGTF